MKPQAPIQMPNRITIRSRFATSSPGFYSFISPVAYYSLRDKNFTCQYFCDGILASALFSTIFRRSIKRISFDYTSIAKQFFDDCAARSRRVLVIGGTPAEAEAFSHHLRSIYAGLKFRCVDGYPSGGYTPERLTEIERYAFDFDVVLLALGSPLQERVGQHLHEHGFSGTIITGGAFVTQTANTVANSYYPRLINALHLRFLWRLIHEPHTRSRFKYVFMFPVSYAIDRARGKVEVICQ